MQKITLYLLLIILFHSCKTEPIQTKVDYAIVIHGGAGTILKKNMSEEMEKAYRKKLAEVITEGNEMLKRGESSELVVIKLISIMENSPLFNAGKGSVFNSEGVNEMDASIMRGNDQQAGAVSGVTIVKNPITAAALVMNKSEHVFLSGDGANQFAAEHECEIVDPDYFYTKRRKELLERTKANEKNKKADKFGTVGCVALDKQGNITAGTSTGGMNNKRYNRIGDSPVIGAGTYADENCGVSCTGHGEYFIRYAVAHDIAARVEYLKENIIEASSYVVNKKLVEKSGSGGVVALDKYGNIAMEFNTEGMYRAYAKNDSIVVKIYGDE